MAIHFKDNRYPGVNAHLHSYLQSHPDVWQSFHSAHITDLTRAIIAVLPQGYYALNEKSLQLIEILPISRGSSSTADIAIYESGRKIVPSPSVSTTIASPPIKVIPVAETLSDEDYLQAVVIYHVEGDEGVPVARVELLSPGNKPPGAHYRQYLAKRDETLQSGICLVEIDYLHERRSPIKAIPSYPADEPEAHPYTILVSDPRPTIDEGKTRIYDFFVGDAIPAITIPLADDDAITVDLGAAYNYTFAQNPYYGMIAVDYARLPMRLESYSEQDRRTIEQLMQSIAATMS